MFCTDEELIAFEAEAQPGEEFLYFSGENLPQQGTATERDTDILNRLRTLYNLGRIDFTQRKLALFSYEYLAIFRNKPAVIDERCMLMVF